MNEETIGTIATVGGLIAAGSAAWALLEYMRAADRRKRQAQWARWSKRKHRR